MNGIFCPSLRLSHLLARPSSSMNGSVHPSVRLSHLLHYVPIIVSSWNFQELLPMTEVTSMQKVKVTEVNTQLSGFRTVNPVQFTYDDEMMHRAWCCLREVPYCFSRSFVKFQGHTAKKIVDFDPHWAFPDCNSSLNSPMTTKWCTRL